jgi:hypothetical protein
MVDRDDDEVQKFLNTLSEHEHDVVTEDLQEAYEILTEKTDDFTNVTGDTLAEAVSEDRDVLRHVLRLSNGHHSTDKWGLLIREELPLETKTDPAVHNEISRRVEDEDGLKSEFFDLMTDILGDDLKGQRGNFNHYDVVEAHYLSSTGTAQRGQDTGDWLENKIREEVLEPIGLEENQHFVHVGGRAEVTFEGEKYTFKKGPDFVVPSLDDAKLLIEAKMYGSSTGSKQTDVLGDISKLQPIVSEGMPLYMTVDGAMWKRRVSDLVEIFERREDGDIEGVYNVDTLNKMKDEIEQVISELDLEITTQEGVDEST